MEAGGTPPPGVPQGRSLARVSLFLSEAGEVLEGYKPMAGQMQGKGGG